jgi:O-antigen/teichoic acid export membrane protein
MACGMVALYSSGILSPALGFITMAAASLGASFYLLDQMRPHIGARAARLWREVCTRHWGFSRWGLGITLALWMQVNGNNLLAGYFLRLEDVGGLGMIYAFALPINHLMGASSRLIVPRFADRSARSGPASIVKSVTFSSILFFAVVGAYWACLSLLSGPVVEFVYGDRYLAYADFVRWGLLYLVFAAGTFPIELGLRSILAPKIVFKVQILTAILTSGASLIGILTIGLPGVFIATAASSAVGLIAMAWSFHAEIRRQRGGSPNGWPAQTC